jgi:hypothetical protein
MAEPKNCATGSSTSPAPIVRTARRTYLRIAQRWPWAGDLVAAHTRLDMLPRPIG